MLPSPPATMPPGDDAFVGTGNVFSEPEVLRRPIEFELWSVTQRLPSAADAMPVGLPPTMDSVRTGVAAVVIRATWFVPGSVAQLLPSGPEVIREGAAAPVRLTWVTVPPG